MPFTATRYRWSDLPADHPMVLLERRRVIGDQAMISHVHLKKGCLVPTHAHFNEQFACILSGSLRFTIGGENDSSREKLTVSAGEVLHLPSNTPHAAEAMEDTVVLDIFSPPSEKTGIDRNR
jgi:quercetin dioxygenase-like cupin family protein